MTTNTLLKAVFLDITGTVIQVKGSVGQHYSTKAQRWGVSLNPDRVEARFSAAFHQQAPLDFRRWSPDRWEEAELLWWYRVVWMAVGGEQFADFDGYFTAVYDDFAQGSSWEVYPEVPGVLQALRRRGLSLVAVSNFDRRVESVLTGLGLMAYFHHLVYSTRAGSAKPDSRIFLQALELVGAQPAQALHVGDSWSADVLGAQGVGLSALWLDRANQDPERHPRITTLTEVLDYISSGGP
ncbi:HAD-IA family hydrolase [Anthocerotibacter panamensis]|uniref:HAD-IA family hydrolase n=1 Tax=Anthocerotibacter panamensis TaxID=2857077 RepID=UPI001C40183D|nr:HAD-IA family hydrolase [Anthocerotibacter panamensis]